MKLGFLPGSKVQHPRPSLFGIQNALEGESVLAPNSSHLPTHPPPIHTQQILHELPANEKAILLHFHSCHKDEELTASY